MSLASQINEQLRVLLDKPKSPITYKHITNLVIKNVISNEVLLNLFLSKYRGDLLIFLLQNTNFTIVNIEKMLSNIKKNILQYDQIQVRMIWSLVLKKKQYSGLRQQWGLMGLLDQSLRRTNQESKENLLWLISSNFELLKGLGEGKIIEAFMKTYCQKYLKQNLYLTPFPFIVLQSIHTSDQVSTQIIDLQTKVVLLQRTLNLLDSTSKKLCYPFQNQCLNLIETLLKQEKIPVDSLLLHSCKRIIDSFLWKKPTREAGRAAHQALVNVQLNIAEEDRGKMLYQIEKEQKLGENDPPLLIQNIIERVNQYRHRQQLLNSEIAKIDTPKIKISSKNNNKSSTPNKRSLNKAKQYPQLQNVIQSCLKLKEENQREIQNRSKSREKSKSKQFSDDMINSRYNPSDIGSSRAEQFDEFAEVSDLIDLAYQYKFS